MNAVPETHSWVNDAEEVSIRHTQRFIPSTSLLASGGGCSKLSLRLWWKITRMFTGWN